ncbi:MAG: COX15/CtaA family protein [Ignavibacteriales bacterium]|nr:COX15/CtaA family protein [Ignavibacteriales bacterium]
MPPMVGGIFYEHGHRMIATFVGFLIVVLAIWLWKAESRRWVKTLGLIALLAVILQGVLGGLTVLFLLPTPISVSHAALAQSFFCLVTSIALFTSPWWQENNLLLDKRKGHKLFLVGLAMTAFIFAQLIIGAIMRHTQSGLAVPDFPLAYGSLIPALDQGAIERYNRILLDADIRIAADGPINAFQVFVHLAHRFWAVAVVAFAVYTVIAFKRLSDDRRLKLLSTGILVLVLVQSAVGALTVLTRKHDLVATAHVAIGALTLVTSVLLTLHVAKLAGIRWKRPAPSHVATEAMA